MRATFCNGNFYRAGRFQLADLEVVAGRIHAFAPPATSRPPADSSHRFIDLEGAFVLPGLIDAHAHLVLSPDAQRHEPLTARVLKGARNAAIQLRAGVTSVRDVGGPGRITVELREAIDAGTLEGPRVQTSASFVCSTGGHVSYWGREADGPDEMQRAVREQRKAGADFIKIMASGGVADEREDPSLAQLTQPELAAIVATARQSGTYVAAHAHPAHAIQMCLEAGVRTIEHASFMDQQCVETALEKSAFIVPTFIVYDVMARSENLSAGQRDLAASVLERKADSFLRAVAAGVQWGVGTDAGSFMPQGQLWQEMRFIQRLGVSADRIIAAATRTNAEIMRSPDVGSLEAGAWADMLVLSDDPTKDLSILENPSLVVKSGQVVHRSQSATTPPTLAPSGGRS